MELGYNYFLCIENVEYCQLGRLEKLLYSFPLRQGRKLLLRLLPTHYIKLSAGYTLVDSVGRTWMDRESEKLDECECSQSTKEGCIVDLLSPKRIAIRYPN
jgi:hypothetical protein